MTRRSLGRAAAAGGGAAACVLLAAGPAFARVQDGEMPAGRLGTLQTLLTFVGAPVALFCAVALLVTAPAMLRRPRYRPGRPWTHEPLWFAGPDDPDAALDAVPAGSGTRVGGGASAEW